MVTRPCPTTTPELLIPFALVPEGNRDSESISVMVPLLYRNARGTGFGLESKNLQPTTWPEPPIEVATETSAPRVFKFLVVPLLNKVAMSAVALDDTPTPASATSATRGENLIFRLKLTQELHERTLAELLYLETKFAASRLLPASPEAINMNVPAIRLVPVRVLAADGPNRRVSGIVANRTCVTLRRFGAQSIRQTYAEV